MSKEFEEVLNDVREGKEPTTTVRELLRWFGAQRRRTGIVKSIQSILDAENIITSPNFTQVWIDAEISFKVAPDVAAVAVPANENQETAEQAAVSKDAVFLIGMLKAANSEVICVNPQDPIQKAITLMLAYDFSQLAVMSNSRRLHGVISWKTIGKRHSQGKSLAIVSDAMSEAVEVLSSEALFKATERIIENEFVFIRSATENTITGIVTSTDLSLQFQFMSEPFLLIGQIENQVRNLLTGKFDVAVLRSICDPADEVRREQIQSVADLTFGEYLRLIQNPENWAQLGLNVCRVVFCDEMNKVREIRNDVMHFDPDGIEEAQYEQLRRFARFLDEL